MTDYVSYEYADGIATVTMNDGKANAFGPPMIAALNGALDQAEAEAKVVVIGGKPGLLSGGFDLKVMNGAPADVQALVKAGGELMLRLYLHPQPVVVANTGHAIALGAIMLFTGDYRIGTGGDFKIGMNETAIGMSLPTFAVELARDRVAPHHLTMATAGATLYAPDDAVAVGYHDEVANAENVATRAWEKAAELEKLDGAAFATVKSRLRSATAEVIRASLATEFPG